MKKGKGGSTLVKILAAIDRGLQTVYDYIMVIAGSAVVLLIMAGAFMRYILKMDFYGSEEIILLFGYWLYFIGSISAARGSSHLSANMVNVFTKNQQVIRLFALIRDVLSLVICLLAISWCADYWEWTWELKPVTSVRRIPYYFQQFTMCLSFLMWGVYLVRDCILSVLHLRGGKEGMEK